MTVKRPKIGVLTSGGDSPGMNAAVRGVVRYAIDCGADAVGIEHGYEGLLDGRFRPLGLGDVGGILDRGGTFLGTSRSERFMKPEGVAEAAKILREARVTGLVVVGGDGSYRGAMELSAAGIPTAGLPGTIDNDINGTDTSIGFDTALNTVIEAISKIRDTASSHERTFVIEVMGRTSGILATYAGLAGGGDCILVPEVQWCLDDVCEAIAIGQRRGKQHSLIVLAEGAGHALTLADQIAESCGYDVRAVVLGHVQRGGAPSAFDRILASRLAEKGVHALLAGESGVAIGLRGANVISYPLSEAYASPHPLRHEIYELSRILAQ